ncbi:centriolin isoform X2 [Cynoglossus semilaevis]|uniref:centriolin isoform X2 n=1 Tax=Cynoglossus semilaevis TaxID=244447 RepID=UPI000D62E0C2|nr:centriolin isoform X2 [Cynoglossus semilaevis]
MEMESRDDGEEEEEEDGEEFRLTAVPTSSGRLLDRMSSKQSELEERLEDVLSRIAMETQEIKELEQQLTDSQILANEALQRDLKGIVSGLQEYLRGLREQAFGAQEKVHSLQAENQTLQRHLEDMQRHCSVDTYTQDTSVQQRELSVLRMEAQALRRRQVESDRLQVELEEELKHLREELTPQVTLGHVTQEFQVKEEQIREMIESELQSTVDTTQGDTSSVQQVVHGLQVQLDQTKNRLHQTKVQYRDAKAQLDRTRTELNHFKMAFLDSERIPCGSEEPSEDKYSLCDAEDVSRSVEQLVTTLQQTRTSRDQLQRDLKYSQQQVAALQAQVVQDRDHIATLEAQLETRDAERTQCHQNQELLSVRDQLQTYQSSNSHLQSELEQSRAQLEELLLQRDTLLLQSHDDQRSLRVLKKKLQNISAGRCESDQLTPAIEQLSGLNRAAKLLLSQTAEDDDVQNSHRGGRVHRAQQLRVEMDEAQKLTHRLQQQLDHGKTKKKNRSRTCDESEMRTDAGEDGWFYVPPGHNVHSLTSQGTQDSGVGLQYRSSPDEGQQQCRPPSGGGYWVYITPSHMDKDQAATSKWRDSGGGDSEADQSCPAGTPSAAPPCPGCSLRHAPLVAPAWLLCGSPAGMIDSSAAGCSTLHCNVIGHRDTGAEPVCECVHTEAEKLQKEGTKLRLETKEIRRTLRQHRSVLQVCEEVECVEKTLLKRRAELRQADRLLLEAHSSVHTTRHKASAAQWEADEWQRRAQEVAACLQEVTQPFRELQTEVEDLRRRGAEEAQNLKEVQEELRSREEELQHLGTKLQSATARLSTLLSDGQEAQKSLGRINHQVKLQEQNLAQRWEEHQAAVTLVKEVREEEHRLQNSVKELMEQQKILLKEKQSTVSAVELEEQKLLALQSEIHTNRAELKLILQELLAEQQALEDMKTKRTQGVQQLLAQKGELDRTQSELDKTREELETVTDRLDRKQTKVESRRSEVRRRTDELETTVQEVETTVKELGRVQEEVDRKKVELASLRQEVDSYTKEAESYLVNMTQQKTELQELQEKLRRRQDEKRSLKEQCTHLEARRRHAERCLSAVEAELTKQREEYIRRQHTDKDAAATQELANVLSF